MPAPRFLKEEKSYKVISTLGGADSFRCRLFALAAMFPEPCRQWLFLRSRAASAVGRGLAFKWSVVFGCNLSGEAVTIARPWVPTCRVGLAVCGHNLRVHGHGELIYVNKTGF